VFESAYEITLRNAKREAVTARKPVPGDWSMLEQSQSHEKAASGTAQWRLSVPAMGSRMLNGIA
jgi:hypothetical protein